MSAFNQELNEALPSKQYYDMQLTNFDSPNNTINFHYSKNSNMPYLINPETYEMSVVKMRLDTGNVPVFIPSIQRNQTDINKTIYSVTLGQWTGTQMEYSDQIYIEWVTQDVTASLPLRTSETSDKFQDNHSGYYYCYNYRHFLSLFNQALASAYTNLGTKVTLPAGKEPKLYWSNDKARFELDDALYRTDVNKVFVYFNNATQNLFHSFNLMRVNQSSSLGLNYTLNLTDYDIITKDSVDYVYFEQEFSTISAWSPFTAIVLTSNTLPVNTNIVSNPEVLENNQVVTVSKNDLHENVITDLTTSDGLYKGSVYYVPTAEYRRITLRGNQPLRNFDLNIFFRSKLGHLIPFKLPSGGSVSIKILFEKIKS